MKRRSFLKSSSFVSVPFLLNGLPISAVGRNSFYQSMDANNDNILVLIQLNGGNDGLNTIIPMEHYDLLANVRSNIIIPESKVIAADNSVGFHSSMTGMKELFDDAKMTVINDVGYPNQNRSHFRSTDIWTSGSPADENWTTGWAGRYFENRFAEFPSGYPNVDHPDPFALSIGANVSETCQGTVANFSLALADPQSITTLDSGGTDTVPDSPYGRELEYLRTTIAQANAYGSVITEAASKGNNLSQLYNDERLANQLRSIALLISGGLKTKVYIANLGGFDTHANQVEGSDPTVGEHAELLSRLSSAVAAFQDDLNKLGLEEKVVTMTFSEFGRRIRSNDSLGTDHGTAAPMMLFGSCVNPGIVGSATELPDDPTQSDGVPMQTDFRDVYGSLLMDWFGIEESEVKSLLFDEFKHIPIIRDCKATTSTDDISAATQVEAFNFPNPFFEQTSIRFTSEGGPIKVSIYDAVGSEVAIISNQTLPAGEHEIKYDGRHLESGNYFYRIQTELGSVTKPMVKIQ